MAQIEDDNSNANGDQDENTVHTVSKASEASEVSH